jgi:hypothetical protein
MKKQWAAETNPPPTAFSWGLWTSLLTDLLPTIAKPDTIGPQLAALALTRT